MKTLILYRHAKSSWEDQNQKDFDRPLNARGKKDAKTQAKKIKKLKLKIDYFIVSPAKRTKKTFAPLIKELKLKKKEYEYNQELYECTATEIKKLVKSAEKKFKTIMIIGHNPAIENFVRRQTSRKHTLVPTATIIILEVSAGASAYKIKEIIKP